jgi:hypothetical protein
MLLESVLRPLYDLGPAEQLIYVKSMSFFSGRLNGGLREVLRLPYEIIGLVPRFLGST